MQTLALRPLIIRCGFLLAGSLLFAGAVRAQDSTEAQIRAIRAEYQRINSMTLRSEAVEPKEESSEGGDVTRYFSGDTLKKIVTDYMGHMGHQKTTFYFAAGKLFFVYSIAYFWDGYMTGKVKRKEENRYYFHNGRIIRWIDEKGKLKDKSEFEEMEKQILADEDLK